MTPHPGLLDPPIAAASPALTVTLIAACDAAQSGNKACNLARLLALGHPVPPAIVITNSVLDAFLDSGGLHPAIATLCRDHGSSPIDRRAIADAIKARLLDQPLPQYLRDAIAAAACTLGPGPFMVRSSACGEDSDAASFAGQLDSFGDVRHGDSLIEAVVNVWASRWSHRVLAYAAAKGTALDAMGVIVQQQVASRWSGVLFTRSPGQATHMLLEFCSGMGEALVSGRTNPGRVTIDRADQRWALDAPPERAEWPLDELVNDRRLRALAGAALAIERAFGRPQDIEWTVDDDGRLWIVQARPIVAAAPARPAPPATAVSPGAALRQVVWSNANVNENFPDPISPLLYSIARDGYYYYFRNLGRSFGLSRRRLAAMEQPLRHIIGVHAARIYYNLTSIHSVLRSAPGGELLAASFNQFVGAPATDAAPAVPFAARVGHTLQHAVELARMAFQILRQYAIVERRVARFEQRVTAFAATTRPALLEQRALPGLLDDFRAFLRIRRHQWNDAALADAGSMVCYGLLQRLLGRAFPEDGQQALHNSLLKALPDLVSGRPAIELHALSELIRADPPLTALFSEPDPVVILEALRLDGRYHHFALALARFQEEWGFRCSGELMLTMPSFQEDPAPLIGLIRNYLTADGPSPLRVLERQVEERLVATARVRRELLARPFVRILPRRLQRFVVMRILSWTQTCIGLRERARLKQALLYSRLRRVVLQIGDRLTADGRLACPDDIFFLTSDEIETLLAGHAMFPQGLRGLVVLRRQEHQRLSSLQPPDTLTLAAGEYYTAGSALPTSSPVAQPALTGLGACGGVVTAPATVLADVRDAHRLRPGDVLVTRQTDPGWGPIFPLISGLVVERGGMLSHGAIIAREFGIPSVVGVQDATRRIRTGSVVRVDGDRGTVETTGGLP